MSPESLHLVVTFGSLFVAGLAGSLHCIGMCGPLLVGFSQGLAGGAGGRARSPRRDFIAYQGGRIWTYGLLGLAAGALGEGARLGAAVHGWQRPAGVGFGALVVLAGVALSGIVPWLRVDRVADACGLSRLPANRWLRTIVATGGFLPRLLLGAVMGLLPCGLVYAALIAAAALPGPAWSGVGMIAFGLGTVPALGATLFLADAGRARIPAARLRAWGSRLAAVALVLTGVWMIGRAWSVEPGPGGCAACVVAAQE